MVWVVWANDYDGVQILGVAATREIGDQIKAAYLAENPGGWYRPGDIEVDEWPVRRL